jgi:hypothetical protein
MSHDATAYATYVSSNPDETPAEYFTPITIKNIRKQAGY